MTDSDTANPDFVTGARSDHGGAQRENHAPEAGVTPGINPDVRAGHEQGRTERTDEWEGAPSGPYYPDIFTPAECDLIHCDDPPAAPDINWEPA